MAKNIFQLPLFDHNEDGKAIRKALLRRTREVVHRVGPKTVAPELNMSPSMLLDCIEERERHGLTFRQWCVILAFDDQGDLVSELADAKGFEQPARKPQLDDSEKLERLLKSLAKAGPAGQAIVADAFGQGGKT